MPPSRGDRKADHHPGRAAGASRYVRCRKRSAFQQRRRRVTAASGAGFGDPVPRARDRDQRDGGKGRSRRSRRRKRCAEIAFADSARVPGIWRSARSRSGPVTASSRQCGIISFCKDGATPDQTRACLRPQKINRPEDQWARRSMGQKINGHVSHPPRAPELDPPMRGLDAVVLRASVRDDNDEADPTTRRTGSGLFGRSAIEPARVCGRGIATGERVAHRMAHRPRLLS